MLSCDIESSLSYAAGDSASGDDVGLKLGDMVL